MPDQASGGVQGDGPGTLGRASSVTERVTVNLTARASSALNQAVQLTGDTKTDSINRALRIYAYLEEVLAKGGAVYVQEDPDSQLELLKIF